MPVSRTQTRTHAKINPGPAMTTLLLDRLREVAGEQVRMPGGDWPADFADLADKIERGQFGQLGPLEAPVTSRDRNRLIHALPRGITAQRNDPARF